MFKTVHIQSNTHASPAQNKVLIIYTGGTLGMTYDKKQRNLVPFPFEQILRKVPELRELACELTVVSFEKLIDSSNMKPTIWIQLAELINAHYHTYDGFVVLHGTDTMAHSASALSFLLEGLQKPVIFTGAQLPISALRTDARRNLLTSIEIAIAKQGDTALVPEVAIFFNDSLLRGNRARKVESSHFDAFQSENYPELAKVGIHIQYNHKAINPHNPLDFLQVHTKMDNNVAILKIFPGISEKIVRSILEIDDLHGVVLETFGSGNAPTDKWFIKAIQEAVERKTWIYNVSQCIGGLVMQGRYATSQAFADLGVVSGKDITSEAAIVKMMFLLAQDLPETQVRLRLAHALRGEMS
jgi:L-asparaginase